QKLSPSLIEAVSQLDTRRSRPVHVGRRQVQRIDGRAVHGDGSLQAILDMRPDDIKLQSQKPTRRRRFRTIEQWIASQQRPIAVLIGHIRLRRTRRRKKRRTAQGWTRQRLGLLCRSRRKLRRLLGGRWSRSRRARLHYWHGRRGQVLRSHVPCRGSNNTAYQETSHFADHLSLPPPDLKFREMPRPGCAPHRS